MLVDCAYFFKSRLSFENCPDLFVYVFFLPFWASLLASKSAVSLPDSTTGVNISSSGFAFFDGDYLDTAAFSLTVNSPGLPLMKISLSYRVNSSFAICSPNSSPIWSIFIFSDSCMSVCKVAILGLSSSFFLVFERLFNVGVLKLAVASCMLSVLSAAFLPKTARFCNASSLTGDSESSSSSSFF